MGTNNNVEVSNLTEEQSDLVKTGLASGIGTLVALIVAGGMKATFRCIAKKSATKKNENDLKEVTDEDKE